MNIQSQNTKGAELTVKPELESLAEDLIKHARRYIGIYLINSDGQRAFEDLFKCVTGTRIPEDTIIATNDEKFINIYHSYAQIQPLGFGTKDKLHSIDDGTKKFLLGKNKIKFIFSEPFSLSILSLGSETPKEVWAPAPILSQVKKTSSDFPKSRSTPVAMGKITKWLAGENIDEESKNILEKQLAKNSLQKEDISVATSSNDSSLNIWKNSVQKNNFKYYVFLTRNIDNERSPKISELEVINFVKNASPIDDMRFKIFTDFKQLDKVWPNDLTEDKYSLIGQLSSKWYKVISSVDEGSSKKFQNMNNETVTVYKENDTGLTSIKIGNSPPETFFFGDVLKNYSLYLRLNDVVDSYIAANPA